MLKLTKLTSLALKFNGNLLTLTLAGIPKPVGPWLHGRCRCEFCLLWQAYKLRVERKLDLPDGIPQRYDEGMSHPVRTYDVTIYGEGILVHDDRAAFTGKNAYQRILVTSEVPEVDYSPS